MRGGSCIINPMGKVLAGPVYGEDVLLTAEIDLDDIPVRRWILTPWATMHGPMCSSSPSTRRRNAPCWLPLAPPPGHRTPHHESLRRSAAPGIDPSLQTRRATRCRGAHPAGTGARAPSGGNLQPWHVHALAGEPLAQLLHLVASEPWQDQPEYAVYPPTCGNPTARGAFATPSSSMPRSTSPRRQRGPPAPDGKECYVLRRPCRHLLSVDRRMGHRNGPTWALPADGDAAGRGAGPGHLCAGILGFPLAARGALSEPACRTHAFAGFALGWRDDARPSMPCTERDPFEVWGEMRGLTPIRAL